VVQRCIASWHRYCPDWEIRLWNESNFDVTLNRFTSEAYEAGKLGFVADCIRLYLLYTYGGIYLDADVELLRPIDGLLDNRAFTGLENIYDASVGWVGLGTAVLGAEKGNPWIKAVMDYYANLHFINPDGSLNMVTSNWIHGRVTQQLYGLEDRGNFRSLHTCTHDYGAVKIYGKEVLFPHNASHITPDSCTLHHCLASWIIPLSVVMPAYNARETIREAIDSILAQTFERFELIIVDDGSTDDTREVIRSYKDKRIVLIENEHDYIGSLNLAVRRATGRYIARMDADDIMLPERLQIQYSYMETHPEIDLLGTGMQFFGENNYLYRPVDGRVTMNDLLTVNRIAHPTVMLRRESLGRIKECYRPECVWAEDYDLWLRMCEAGLVLWNIPQTLLLYRVNPTGVTSSRQNEMTEAVEKIKRSYIPALTVIIPFLNEGDEVEKTVVSIRETVTGNPKIILINDASTDGTDYATVAHRYGCRYIEHPERRGVAASRDEGVALCETPYFILLDAHMEFYEQAWDRRLATLLQANPRSLMCLNTRVLYESRDNKKNDVPVYGAVLSMNGEDILKCKWNYIDPNPASNIVDIEVPLGGAYATARDYWLEFGGLHGLIGYGMDEEMIALKVRRSGGRCRLIKDLVAGHIYRSRFPYAVTNEFILHNQILIADTLLEGEERTIALERLKAKHGERFDRIYNSVKLNNKIETKIELKTPHD
jgi:glycosyltransferase involved in cell wall biosynthesis